MSPVISAFAGKSIPFAFIALLLVLSVDIAAHLGLPIDPPSAAHVVSATILVLLALLGRRFIVRKERARALQRLGSSLQVIEQLRVQTAALEAAANAIVITDREGKIVWVNPAYSRLTGRSLQEAIGTVPNILTSPASAHGDPWQTILSGAVWCGEILNTRKDGVSFVEQVTITPVRAPDGEISHFIAIKVDLSESMRAAEALAQSEATLRSQVQNAPYGIYRSTPEGRILGGNPAICRMLGYESEQELKSRNFQDLYYDPNDRAAILETLLRDGDLRNVECRWKRRGGTPIYVRLSAHICPGPEDTKTFEGFVEEITESKRADLELRRLNRALSTLGRCNEALVHATSEPQLLNEVCDILVKIGGYRLAWIGYADQNEEKTVTPKAKAGDDDGYVEDLRISWSDNESGRGPVGASIRSGEAVIFRDIRRVQEFKLWRDAALRRGYISVISLPLKQGEHLIGALAIYTSDVEALDDREVELLRELADDLSYGIVSIRNELNHRVAEARLRDSEHRYRTLFERNPHPMWICDVESRQFLEVNDAAIAQYGYTRDQFLRLRLDDIRPQEDLEKLHTTLSEATSGYTFSGASRHLTRDGALKYVEIAAYRFHQQGRLLSLTLASDVTKRERAEQALRASEHRYRMLYDHNLAAVFNCTNAKMIRCNEAMCRMLGYSREELLALDFRTLYVDHNVCDEGLSLLLESGLLINRQVELRRKDGSTITVLANLNLTHETPGDSPVITGVMLDITEVSKLQQQLLQAQKMEAIGKLTGGIAHDFNNILMIINSYSELMLEKVPSDSSLRHPLEQVKSAGNRAASLTRQLLAFSRNQVMTPTVLDLNAVISEMKDMLKRLIGEDVALEILPADDLSLTEADQSQIVQVVMNLAVNARDAMPNGGKLTIRSSNAELGDEFVRAHPGCIAGRYVALTISDTGTGIPPEVQSRIFEPFFTTKAPGKGTGLGLSTVYGIVKQSGGYITVESKGGEGTTFCVYLPQTDHKQIAAEESQVEAAEKHRATILLVEDEQGTREAITEYLGQNGFRVIASPSAASALHEFEATPAVQIDVLLTDVVMPGMSGADLATRFRSLCPNAKIILMSGYTDDVLLRSGLQQSQFALLSKPFRLQHLVSKLKEVLGSAA